MNDDTEETLVGVFVGVFLIICFGYFFIKTFHFLRSLPEVYAITRTYVPFMHNTNGAIRGLWDKNSELEKRISNLEKK